MHFTFRKPANLVLAGAVGLVAPAHAMAQIGSETHIDAGTAQFSMLGNDPAVLDLGTVLEDSASPFDAVEISDAEIAAIEVPVLNGPVDDNDRANFDKYYYFHRDQTDIRSALNDITECDGYSSGRVSHMAWVDTPYPYSASVAGAIGGSIGNVIAQAVIGSSEIRKMRRVNMRACMSFKGYQRFGLPKNLWKEFNFEEGFDQTELTERLRALRMQALVASTVQPVGEVLEP